MIRSYFVGAVLVGVLLGVAGCDSPSKLIEVEGEVTLDDAPVKAGDIFFIPEDKTVGPEAGKIVDGKYKVRSKPGKMRVEIRANREVPGKKGPMGEPLLEDIIPTQYNEKSTLSADVSSSQKTFNFPLKSKK